MEKETTELTGTTQTTGTTSYDEFKKHNMYMEDIMDVYDDDGMLVITFWDVISNEEKNIRLSPNKAKELQLHINVVKAQKSLSQHIINNN